MAATTPAARVARRCSSEMAVTNGVLSDDKETNIVLATSSRIYLGYRLSA